MFDDWRGYAHDVVEATLLRRVFHTRYTWLGVAAGFLMAALVAIAAGWLLGEFGPLPVVVLAFAFGLGLWMLRDIEVAFWGVLGIIALLPFGSLPFKVGFTPTFLDLALLALFGLWFVPIMLGRDPDWRVTPLDGPVLAFMLLAISSFVAGLSHGALTSYLIRHFAEILLSIAIFYVVVNLVRDSERLERLLRVFLLVSAGAAVLGIVLYYLPDDLTIRLLSALGRFGYPTGSGVLRYIRDDPELMQRATSTSVDPNALGSLLNVALALATPQLFARRPIFKRVVLFPLLAVLVACLGLTISRGAVAGAAGALLALGVVRYRKLLLLLLIALLLVLLLPWTQGFVSHFLEGVRGEDLSTKMRFGEYKDALILIERYPLLGVGFAGSPDIDTYIGVANVYLIIAEQMGLVGLGVFLLICASLFFRFWKRRSTARALPRLEPLWYGLHAAVLGGLGAGLFDRYFFSLDFHHSVTLFWILLALATATTQLVDSANAQHSESLASGLHSTAWKDVAGVAN
ncbi:MAG: O-antigen ligase family protein [Anaerolineae bacterium]|nr:O-antigen ligase family protein [Anaerolineae bacterium]